MDGRGELGGLKEAKSEMEERKRRRNYFLAIHVQTLYVKCVTVICNYMCQTYNACKLKLLAHSVWAFVIFCSVINSRSFCHHPIVHVTL